MEYAIFDDCRHLVDRFVAEDNSSFESFCKQWKKLQFQHLFAGQTTYVETMQTTAAVIHYARRELCQRAGNETYKSITTDLNTTAQHFTDEEIRRRIGCLFLLYAIYFKQPTEQFIKIETSLTTWRSINSFVNTLPMSLDMDSARYVFYRLLEANAFRFTALDYCVGLEELVDYDQLNDKENTKFLSKVSGKELGQQLQDFPATQRILPALSVLEDGYNEMKEMLIKTNTNGMHKKSLPTTSIFKSIEQCFKNIQSILDDNTGAMRRCKTIPSEITRQNLKRKRFRKKAIDANDDGSDISEDVGAKKGQYKALRRMSARTVFTEQLPADLLEDLGEQADLEKRELSEETEGRRLVIDENWEETPPEKANKEETCKLPDVPVRKEEAIEKHLNDLLEIELTEEFISISQNERL
ncbi:snRNA-activating protein complex subunit 1 [Eurosta solidaginis]|uniref:snRNA-activating protein complex subunit 1 n=1 Tax=Eurosta solidaginis TaxID=178769 RepID=UPI003530604B